MSGAIIGAGERPAAARLFHDADDPQRRPDAVGVDPVDLRDRGGPGEGVAVTVPQHSHERPGRTGYQARLVRRASRHLLRWAESRVGASDASLRVRNGLGAVVHGNTVVGAALRALCAGTDVGSSPRRGVGSWRRHDGVARVEGSCRSHHAARRARRARGGARRNHQLSRCSCVCAIESLSRKVRGRVAARRRIDLCQGLVGSPGQARAGEYGRYSQPRSRPLGAQLARRRAVEQDHWSPCDHVWRGETDVRIRWLQVGGVGLLPCTALRVLANRSGTTCGPTTGRSAPSALPTDDGPSRLERIGKSEAVCRCRGGRRPEWRRARPSTRGRIPRKVSACAARWRLISAAGRPGVRR